MPLSRPRNATLSRPLSPNLLQVTHAVRRGSGDSGICCGFTARNNRVFQFSMKSARKKTALTAKAF